MLYVNWSRSFGIGISNQLSLVYFENLPASIFQLPPSSQLKTAFSTSNDLGCLNPLRCRP